MKIGRLFAGGVTGDILPIFLLVVGVIAAAVLVGYVVYRMAKAPNYSWKAQQRRAATENQFAINRVPTATGTSVIDIYGNNAATVCPACKGPYLVSAGVGKRNGNENYRDCPRCGGSTLYITRGKAPYAVRLEAS